MAHHVPARQRPGARHGVLTAFDDRQVGFLRPFASVGLAKTGLFFEGDRIAEYRLRDTRAGVDLGANLGAYGQASVGWLERHLRSTRDTGPTILPDATFRFGGATARLALDTQDYAFFPTRGFRADVTYFDAQRVSEGMSKYGRAEARLGGAWSIGDLTLLGSLEGGKSTHGSLPLGDTFSLGGMRRLSAFAPGQILGGEYGLGTMQVQWRLTRPMPILGLSLLGGLSLETGPLHEPSTSRRTLAPARFLRDLFRRQHALTITSATRFERPARRSSSFLGTPESGECRQRASARARSRRTELLEGGRFS